MARPALEPLPAGALPDPVALVKHQLARDKARTAWRPSLLVRKNERMRASPFAFLRGTAPLYYELLATCPWLAEGPPGEGWLVGDLHLENFGAFRRAAPHEDGPDIAFNVNDFDDAVQGPWYLDVLRLTTSLILAAREIGAQGALAIEMARSLLESYRTVMGTDHLPKPPRLVTGLIEKVQTRSRVELLDSRTKVNGKKRKFVHGERYDELPAELRDGVVEALATYTPADGGPRPPDDHLELIDAAFRIAGTGSLGGRRVAALTNGKGGVDGAWIFDLKEEDEPSAALLLGPSKLGPNVRVATAARACLGRPQHMLGTTTLAGRSMVVRRLMPQEDKLDASSLKPEQLHELVPYFGALAAQAHLRGASKTPRHPWSAEDAVGVLSNAATLAGWHEAAYLAFSHSLVPG